MNDFIQVPKAQASLRDQIAAAIEECPMPIDGQEWSELLADAVIAELEANYILAPIRRSPPQPGNGRWDCNPHPDAPHGFDRSGSHTWDRYVCDCEGWDADE